MTLSLDARCVVVTGGAGFIGSNLIRCLLRNDPDARVINYDALTYAGNIENLTDVAAEYGANAEKRYWFVRGDIRDHGTVTAVLRGTATAHDGTPVPAPDAVVHLAAETHVDRSILDAGEFISTNVNGTHTLLSAMREASEGRARPMRLVHVSTDEVYGSLSPSEAPFTEQSPLAPNSPYAASKASSDLLVRAFARTYGLDAVITRCSNNYGAYQFPEKLIPLMITRALSDLPLPVYGDGQQVRDWLHVDDHANAISTILRSDADGVFNIGGSCERANLQVVRAILAILGKPESLIQYVDDRAGHDRRYAIDSSHLQSTLGWKPQQEFERGLEATVRWYVEHGTWWERVQSEAYRAANALYL